MISEVVLDGGGCFSPAGIVGLDSLLRRLLLCVWESTAARSCAVRDDNNKDNESKPTVPAGLKHPPPSKTTSIFTRFEA